MPQESVDPVVRLLLKSPLTPAQRRSASEAFTGSTDEDDLAAKIGPMNIPKEVKRALWDLKYQAPASQNGYTGSQPAMGASEPQGSAADRFLSNAGEMLNPVTMATGVYNSFRHPIDTATGILNQANDQRLKAHEAQDRGDYGEMAARSLAAAIPIVGPMAAQVGEQIGSGDVAGGLGKATGIAALYAAPKLLGEKAPNPVKADALRRQAESTVAEKVLAPANPKYKAAAAKVAPELLKRGIQGDRIALQQWAEDLIGESKGKIDQVIDSYPDTAKLSTKPVLKSLDEGLQKLTYDTTAGTEVNPALKPIYDKLRQQHAFVSRLGDEMSFADMRRLRQQMDSVAEEAGAFAAKSGDTNLSAAGQAALDTANALRRQIASERPELAVPNADMNLALTVRDILDPTKGRPKTASVTTGATGGLHTTAAIIGSGVSNVPGLKAIAAFVASDVIPRIKNAQVSPANQLRLANDMQKLSESLAAGKTSAAQKAMLNLSMYVPGLSGQVGRLTTEPGTTP